MSNEKRLIDANALKASFDEQYDSAFMQMHTRDNKEYWDGFCGGVNWARNELTDTPTVDVIEGVRCKDCKHWEDGYFGYCTKVHTAMDYDDYCAYGERKDNDLRRAYTGE